MLKFQPRSSTLNRSETQRPPRNLGYDKILVSYQKYKDETVQEVFTETGMLQTYKSSFACVPTKNNPDRSLAKKLNELFVDFYKSQKKDKVKEKYLATVFSKCSRSSFVDLKASVGKIRSSGAVGSYVNSRSLKD